MITTDNVRIARTLPTGRPSGGQYFGEPSGSSVMIEPLSFEQVFIPELIATSDSVRDASVGILLPVHTDTVYSGSPPARSRIQVISPPETQLIIYKALVQKFVRLTVSRRRTRRHCFVYACG